MAWLSEQKPKGKFYGLLAGSFMAASWGHWHDRIFSHFGIRCSRLYTQLAILGVPSSPRRSRSSLATTSPATGAREPTSTLPTICSSTTTSSPAISPPSCSPPFIQREL